MKTTPNFPELKHLSALARTERVEFHRALDVIIVWSCFIGTAVAAAKIARRLPSAVAVATTSIASSHRFKDTRFPKESRE
jgi:hypothetical protein